MGLVKGHVLKEINSEKNLSGANPICRILQTETLPPNHHLIEIQQ